MCAVGPHIVDHMLGKFLVSAGQSSLRLREVQLQEMGGTNKLVAMEFIVEFVLLATPQTQVAFSIFNILFVAFFFVCAVFAGEAGTIVQGTVGL